MTYQYATISSSIDEGNADLLSTETDTLKIAYDFRGEKGPVKISIYNKLDVPLYVDWSKSALIVENIRTLYWNKKSIINAEVTTSRYQSGVSRTSTLEGTLINQEAVSFIPPKSWTKEYTLNLNPDFFTVSSFTEKDKVNGQVVKSASFTKENSPLRFRSFLTLSSTPDFKSPRYFDHNFWISEISQTSAGPRYFDLKDDQFFVKGLFTE
jgi:hypothetical protein